MKDQLLRSEGQRPGIYETTLWKCIRILWLLTIAASFEDGALLKISFPGIGALYGFRVFLALSAVLFAVWVIRYRVRLWRGASALVRWTYIFAAVMIVYGAISLPRAIDFENSIRMLFNLALDMVFFFIMLEVCRDEVLRRRTFTVCAVCLIILLAAGVREVFFGGLINDAYDQFHTFSWLGSYYQSPIVFAQNTNDFISGIVFMLSVLTMGGVLWRCDSRKNVFLTVSVTALVFFLNRAADARLCFLGLCVFLFGTALYVLIRNTDRKRSLLCLGLVLLCILFILFAQSPLLNKGQPPSETLMEEFFETDPQTGEKVLRQYNSAGVRARLILHCVHCFMESHGLGVGLGNTALLAEQRAIAIMYSGRPYGSIHCFIARVLSDYGVFAAVPLIAIGALLLKAAFLAFRRAVRSRDRSALGRAVLFFFMLLTYPFLSTAPSDAQDIIPMWIFLAAVIHEADSLSALEKKEGEDDA